MIFSGGLSPGDIITRINGKDVHNTSDIYSILSEKGKALNMTVFRGTQKLGKLSIHPHPHGSCCYGLKRLVFFSFVEIMIVPEEIDE